MHNVDTSHSLADEDLVSWLTCEAGGAWGTLSALWEKGCCPLGLVERGCLQRPVGQMEGPIRYMETEVSPAPAAHVEGRIPTYRGRLRQPNTELHVFIFHNFWKINIVISITRPMLSYTEPSYINTLNINANIGTYICIHCSYTIPHSYIQYMLMESMDQRFDVKPSQHLEKK